MVSNNNYDVTSDDYSNNPLYNPLLEAQIEALNGLDQTQTGSSSASVASASASASKNASDIQLADDLGITPLADDSSKSTAVKPIQDDDGDPNNLQNDLRHRARSLLNLNKKI